jgi:hypothetical protein
MSHSHTRLHSITLTPILCQSHILSLPFPLAVIQFTLTHLSLTVTFTLTCHSHSLSLSVTLNRRYIQSLTLTPTVLHSLSLLLSLTECQSHLLSLTNFIDLLQNTFILPSYRSAQSLVYFEDLIISLQYLYWC